MKQMKDKSFAAYWAHVTRAERVRNAIKVLEAKLAKIEEEDAKQGKDHYETV